MVLTTYSMRITLPSTFMRQKYGVPRTKMLQLAIVPTDQFKPGVSLGWAQVKVTYRGRRTSHKTGSKTKSSGKQNFMRESALYSRSISIIPGQVTFYHKSASSVVPASDKKNPVACKRYQSLPSDTIDNIVLRLDNTSHTPFHLSYSSSSRTNSCKKIPVSHKSSRKNPVAPKRFQILPPNTIDNLIMLENTSDPHFDLSYSMMI